MRLVQYTRGKAKGAIRFGTLMEGSKGYFHAREMLQKRFDNSHLVTQRVVHHLNKENP